MSILFQLAVTTLGQRALQFKLTTAAAVGTYLIGATGLLGYNGLYLDITPEKTQVWHEPKNYMFEKKQILTCAAPSSTSVLVPRTGLINYYYILQSSDKDHKQNEYLSISWRPNKVFLNGTEIDHFSGVFFTNKNYELKRRTHDAAFYRMNRK